VIVRTFLSVPDASSSRFQFVSLSSTRLLFISRCAIVLKSHLPDIPQALLLSYIIETQSGNVNICLYLLLLLYYDVTGLRGMALLYEESLQILYIGLAQSGGLL